MMPSQVHTKERLGSIEGKLDRLVATLVDKKGRFGKKDKRNGRGSAADGGEEPTNVVPVPLVEVEVGQ